MSWEESRLADNTVAYHAVGGVGRRSHYIQCTALLANILSTNAQCLQL